MYRVGILGNCCTHGAGAAQHFRRDPRTQVVTGYEARSPRAEELEQAMNAPLARSYEQVAQDPRVQIAVVTADPCDKAHMVELAAAQGKALFVNKPLSHTPSAARHIVETARRYNAPAVFDAPMVKSLPAFDKLMREVWDGRHGRVINYHHSFGMTFAQDFAIRDIWPERFDPPSRSGGGEMTNMGCYAIDYALHTLGMPRQVAARWSKFWAPYAEADVENFGQIMLDYGSFWAVLAVGKQGARGKPGPRNALTIEFESANLFLDPAAGTFIENGRARSLDEYVSGHRCRSALDQLIRCMEEGVPPDSDLETAAAGVEVSCAAYQSILENRPIPFPMRTPTNPLFE